MEKQLSNDSININIQLAREKCYIGNYKDAAENYQLAQKIIK